MSATIIHMEDWTHGDPMEQARIQIEALPELDPVVANDLQIILQEIARCRRIEHAAAEIVRQFRAGNIKPVTPKACLAIVELEASRPECKQ